METSFPSEIVVPGVFVRVKERVYRNPADAGPHPPTGTPDRPSPKSGGGRGSKT